MKLKGKVKLECFVKLEIVERFRSIAVKMGLKEAELLRRGVEYIVRKYDNDR